MGGDGLDAPSAEQGLTTIFSAAIPAHGGPLDNRLGYARHWTREGKDPFAGLGRIWLESREAPEGWTHDQALAWRPLLRTGESFFDLIRRVADETAVDHPLVRGEDRAGFADDLAFALSRSYLAWSSLLPEAYDLAPAANLADAERIVGSRMIRSLLKRVAEGDDEAEAEALSFGVPAGVIEDAVKGIVPASDALAFSPESVIEQLLRNGRALCRFKSEECSTKSWAVVNPAPMIEPVSQTFDFASFRHAIHLAALCGRREGGEVTLGLSNLSGTLLAFDAPYDSPRGLAISASLAGLMMSEAVKLSAEALESEPEMTPQTQAALEALLHSLEVLNELPIVLGPMDSVRWRDVALKSLKEAAQAATSNGVSASVQTGTPCRTDLDALAGAAGTGFGAAASLRDGEGLRGEVKSALQMIGLRGEELDEALDSIRRDEWPAQILEESQSIFRTAEPSPWGQVHPSAQLQRAVDLKPFHLKSTCAAIACPGFDQQTVRHLMEAAQEAGLDALHLIGRGESSAPLHAAPAGEAQVYEVNFEEKSLKVMVAKNPPHVAFHAGGATSEEAGLLNALAGLASNLLAAGISLRSVAEKMPEENSWAGAFRAALLAVAESE